jgi:hypothetical protein
VKQLAYIRPRYINLVKYQLPSCEFDRSDALAPIPAALKSQLDPPDELENYLQLFRHTPVAWFRYLEPRLREINTRERLWRLVEAAQQNAGRMTKLANGSTAASQVYSASYSLIEQVRKRATELMITKKPSPGKTATVSPWQMSLWEILWMAPTVVTALPRPQHLSLKHR